MDIVGKVEDARDDLRLKRLKGKLEDATVQGQLLREENRLLHEELSRQASQKPHTVRRLLSLTVAAGCAYVVGARAGRERYEQVRGWARRVADRGMGADPPSDKAARAVTEAGTAVADATSEIGDAGKEAIARTEDAVRGATDRISGAAKKAVEPSDDADTR